MVAVALERNCQESGDPTRLDYEIEGSVGGLITIARTGLALGGQVDICDHDGVPDARLGPVVEIRVPWQPVHLQRFAKGGDVGNNFGGGYGGMAVIGAGIDVLRRDGVDVRVAIQDAFRQALWRDERVGCRPCGVPMRPAPWFRHDLSFHVGLLLAVLLAGLPDPGEAQGFRRGEQFGTLSFGGGATTLSPKDFVWTDEKFPEGLRLPSRDTGAPSMEMSLGAMATERLAIVVGFLDITTANVSDVPGRLWNINLHGSVRYWVLRRLWVEGGAGPTYTSVAIGEGDAQVDSGEWGWGALSAVAYELVQARYTNSGAHVMVPIQLRVSTNSAGGVRSNAWAVLSGIAVGW
jgi:hypothetical protein